MIYFFIFCSICLLVSNITLGVLLYRSIKQIQEYENDVEILRKPFQLLHDSCIEILNKELYTDDPVVTAFLANIKQLDSEVKFLKLLTEK